MVRFSGATLQERLRARLPVTNTYLAIYQITLDNPHVSLRNGTDRANFSLDVAVDLHIANETKALEGLLDVSSGIKYVADRGALYLTDPFIERQALQGVPDNYAQSTRKALNMALAEFLAGRPIYLQVTGDGRQPPQRLNLEGVVIEDSELVVTLGV